MGEDVILGKGVTKIMYLKEPTPTAYHCSFDWLLPVVQKMKEDNILSHEIKEKIENLDFFVYKEVVDVISSLKN